jgi:hypothetical protein
MCPEQTVTYLSNRTGQSGYPSGQDFSLGGKWTPKTAKIAALIGRASNGRGYRMHEGAGAGRLGQGGGENPAGGAVSA